MPFFTLDTTFHHARAGRLETAHGTALTPMFMTVGTRATVKALDQQDLAAINPQMLLANTYHLYLRPGHERIARLGGVHRFMGYDRPMLTDSGGFQVFSLGAQVKKAGDAGNFKPAKVEEEGVRFTSALDGSEHFFSPELSLRIQAALGADIIMAFDECLSDDADEAYAARSLERTFRWAQRSVAAWESAGQVSWQGHQQALFGIVQGGLFSELRQRAAAQIASLPVNGIAFGGESVGYNMPATVAILDWVRELIPADMPRYAMGLGRDPQNLIDAVMAGYDMFDCVGPTRLARNGALYVGELDTAVWPWVWSSDSAKGRLQIGNAQYAEDTLVIQPGCDCATCQAGYTRAYLHHLFCSDELSYYRLGTIHNVRTMVRLTEQLRASIMQQERE